MKTSTSNKPWIDAYEPHAWKTYELPVGTHALPFLEEDRSFIICSAESATAKILWDKGVREQAFYYDFEQLISADFDQVYGVAGSLRRLSEPWQGHSKGALVLVTYKGRQEGIFTYLIQDI